MFRSLRAQLVLIIAFLLVVVVALTTLMYWGTQTVTQHFERSDAAHKSLEDYIFLSLESYRYFKKFTYFALSQEGAEARELSQSRRDLRKRLERLKQHTRKEIDAIPDPAERQSEAEELVRIAKIEDVLEGIFTAFDKIRGMQIQGKLEESSMVLRRARDDLIADEFRLLIDTATLEEQREAEEADLHAIMLLGGLQRSVLLVSVATLLVALIGAYSLVSRIRKPIEQLVQGTERIANGDLAYRIRVEGSSELVKLGEKFNSMAFELERHQQALLAVQASLENRVDGRTRELRTANEALQKLNTVRQQFFADVSHELRTPLTVIRGEAEVALRRNTVEPAEYETALMRILEATTQSSMLVDDLLFMARTESGGVRMRAANVSLTELVNGASENALVLGASNRTKIRTQVPEERVSVRGDRQRLKQLLLILIDNAVRYCNQEGNIVVSLATKDNHAIVEIGDDGIGMSEEDLELAFERFYRGKRAREFASSGSGLGLPLAKAIVEAHQGKISISSTEGAGTKVTISLPLIAHLERTDADPYR